MSAPSPNSPSTAPLVRVSAAEAGMKLLRFLERRLADGQPRSLLHKWLRTGQVRVNGSRAKAFDLLAEGDAVRLPPFARLRPGSDAPSGDDGDKKPLTSARLGTGLRLLADEADCLVLVKAGGLPSQGGSGHTDSVARRLARTFADAAFIPAPAHRLDKDTSGLMLAGKSHAAQQTLHRLFACGGIAKYYLALVRGPAPRQGLFLLRDHLSAGREADGREQVCARPGGLCLGLDDPLARELLRLPHDTSPGLALTLGLSVPVCASALLCSPASGKAGRQPGQDRLARADCGAGPDSQQDGTRQTKAEQSALLLLRPLTGRKHQLRVQLASRGLPIIGDRRYGSGRDKSLARLYLHAWRLCLPRIDLAGRISAGPDRVFTELPDWDGARALDPASLQQVCELLQRSAPALLPSAAPCDRSDC